jgi:hypothetical protein
MHRALLCCRSFHLTVRRQQELLLHTARLMSPHQPHTSISAAKASTPMHQRQQRRRRTVQATLDLKSLGMGELGAEGELPEAVRAAALRILAACVEVSEADQCPQRAAQCDFRGSGLSSRLWQDWF